MINTPIGVFQVAEKIGWRCKDEKVMSPEQLLEKVRLIRCAWKPMELRDRALVITLYLTGGRVGEIVRHGFLGTGKDGICKQDIKIMEEGGRRFRVFDIRNLKNRQRKHKEVPVSESDPVEGEMLKLLDEYLKNLYDTEPMFPISTKRARQIIKKHMGKELSPHYFRHMRATHLARLKEFTEWELASYMGWSGPGPARHYVHDDPKRLLNKM